MTDQFVCYTKILWIYTPANNRRYQYSVHIPNIIIIHNVIDIIIIVFNVIVHTYIIFP